MFKHGHQEWDSLHFWLWFPLHGLYSQANMHPTSLVTTPEIQHPFSRDDSTPFQEMTALRKGSHWPRLIHTPVLRISPTGNSWSENVGRVDPERKKCFATRIKCARQAQSLGATYSSCPCPRPCLCSHISLCGNVVLLPRLNVPPSNPHLPWKPSPAFQPTQISPCFELPVCQWSICSVLL